MKKAAKKAAKKGDRAPGLLPLMRPGLNMRDIIKQAAMLEDHLTNPKKRCPECIRKHAMTIEGLAEECASLAGDGDARVGEDAHRVARTARVLHHAWEAGRGAPAVCVAVANRLRAMRKGLMRTYAALPLSSLPRGEAAEVAEIVRATKTKRA